MRRRGEQESSLSYTFRIVINGIALVIIVIHIVGLLLGFVVVVLLVYEIFDDSHEKMLLEKWEETIYETGLLYDYNFVMTTDIPDMPSGALYIFDADGYGRYVTEYYYQSFDGETMKKLRNFKNVYNKCMFIDEEKKTIVSSGNFGFSHYVTKNEAVKTFLTHFEYSEKQDAIECIIENDITNFSLVYKAKLFTEVEMNDLFVFIYNELNTPGSLLYTYDKNISEEELNQLLYELLYKTEKLAPQMHKNPLTSVALGNKHEKSELPDDVWHIYYLSSYMDNNGFPVESAQAMMKERLILLIEGEVPDDRMKD